VSGSIAAARDLEETDTADRQLSRRKIFKSAVGVAAAGAAGASVLAKASPASAATTTEQGALAPAVVGLTDAATIAVDASLGNDFRVTIAGNRTMGNPANPTDGQKVVFEITQGSGGSNTITWGSAYEFSASLPQPTLSTAASQADLLGFIYNGDIGKWLHATYVNGFTGTTVASPSPSTSPSTSPSPSPSPSTSTSTSGTYRLFPSTNGPSSPVSYSGPFMAGILFKVTTGGCWLDGYWWWVCPSGQSATAQKFALWCVYNTGVGTLVPAATVTSGSLTPGAWNYVPLATPVPLAIGACYNACTGFSGSFPDNQSQFGSGEPYKAGIVNGPLSAFSDQSGTLPAPFSMSQGVFSVSGSDPSALMPSNGNQSDNLWMDLQVTTTAPTGTSYRLWPNYPRLPSSASAGPYTLATEFTLSGSCTVKNIWFYSAPGATALPTRCAIWNVSTKSVVSGTDNTSPTWSGAAGSCWVSCSYSGVSLPAGDYKVAVFYGGSSDWFLFTTGYWAGTGPGASGIASGPLTAPSNSQAASPGQATYNGGTWAYPQTYGTEGNGENYWVDIEVTPS
jgi:hypothetical protein